MKNQSLSFLFCCFLIPSIYGGVGQTAIRSVVAQGGELTMLLHVAVAGDYEVNIYSTDGRNVYTQTLHEQAGEVEQKIPFAAREHGVYSVNISGAGVQSTRQVMW